MKDVMRMLVLLLVYLTTDIVTAEQDACETVAEWNQPAHAYAADDRLVTVVQDMGPQVFYTVRCNDTQEGRPCNGIHDAFQSQCETRYNLVMALVYTSSPQKRTSLRGLLLDAEGADPAGTRWEMIKVPGQCVCTGLRRKLKRSIAATVFS